MTDTTPLEAATKVLEDLDAKLIRHKQKGVELGDERSSISLSAHTGDKSARARLDKLNAEISTHQSESESLHAAIEAQEKIVAAARSDEQSTEVRAKATEAEVNYRWLMEHGPKLSEHAVALAALLTEVKRRLDANHALGFQFPTSMQFISAMTRATSAMIMTLPLKNFEHEFLQPGQRFNYGEVIKGWGLTGLRYTEQQLKEKVDVDA